MESRDEIVVLHVDDGSAFVETASQLLAREDERLVVETATSAAAALDVLAEIDVDCIVSDYEMPDCDGIAFLEAVRAEYDDLPFILFTGKGSEEIASDAISAGVTDYLQKGAGTSQYAVLANRVTNAVATARSRDRAATMHRMQKVLRDVNQRLVRAESRAQIEADVCTVISRIEPYGLVWIGAPAGGIVTVRASAGPATDYLDALTVEIDDAAPAVEPTAQALGGATSVVVQSIPDDPAPESWEALAREHGLRGVVTVPLVHDGRQFGALSVYSDQPAFFDQREHSLLAELGEDVAHAIHRAENERELRDKQADLRVYERAVASSSDLLAGIDTDYTLIFANERYREFHGISEDAVGEIPLPDALGEVWSEQIKAREDRVLDGAILNYEVTRTGPDGDERTFSVRDYPLKDRDGTILGVVGAMRDITPRKIAERELKRYKERYDLAVEAAEIGIWDWDIRTDEVQFNEQWATMLGYSIAEIDDTLDAWEQRVHPEDLPDVTAALDAHLAGETDRYESEHRMRTAGGAWKWVQDIGRVTRRDEDGDPLRAVGVHIDVDDRVG
ncbi:PAS domain-containing protein [Halorhabdus sp. CUG00001]|uniref:PAS domain-containing protein n=1 Tax=Halorhabdus sp. CUG00001 TaxID=2600297 RepID=UPI00131C083F|nr:PAS domain-containing protein [Halorhabdus sp. CUG00001]